MVLGADVDVEDDPRAPERLIWEETGAGPGVGHHHD